LLLHKKRRIPSPRSRRGGKKKKELHELGHAGEGKSRHRRWVERKKDSSLGGQKKKGSAGGKRGLFL